MRTKDEIVSNFITRLNRTNKISKGDVLKFEQDLNINMITAEFPIDSFTTIPSNLNVLQVKNFLANGRYVSLSGEKKLTYHTILNGFIVGSTEDFVKVFGKDPDRRKVFIGYTDVVKVYNNEIMDQQKAELKSFHSLTLSEFVLLKDDLLAVLNRKAIDYHEAFGRDRLRQVGLEALVIASCYLSYVLYHNLCEDHTQVYPHTKEMMFTKKETGRYYASVPEFVKDPNKLVSHVAGLNNLNNYRDLISHYHLLQNITVAEYEDDMVFTLLAPTEGNDEYLNYIRNKMTVDDVMDLIVFTVWVIDQLKTIGHDIKLDKDDMRMSTHDILNDIEIYETTMRVAGNFVSDFTKTMKSFTHIQDKKDDDHGCDCDDDDD